MAAHSWDVRRIWSASAGAGLLTVTPMSCHVSRTDLATTTLPGCCRSQSLPNYWVRPVSRTITLLGQLTRAMNVADCRRPGSPRHADTGMAVSPQPQAFAWSSGVVELLAGSHGAEQQTRTL